MGILIPTDARKDFYSVLKKVNENHQAVIINGESKRTGI